MPLLPDDLENTSEKPSDPVDLASPRKTLSRPEGYKPDPGLVDALKVALLLRKPLLLTGRPGTGKTELGHYLAWKMRLSVSGDSEEHGHAYQFNAKSNSIARDLFYTYDAVGHFRGGSGDVRPYLTFNAIGKAFQKCAVPTDELRELLPGFIAQEPKQSVVVIDEIDKAPRDFPNDLLNEIDRKYFYIPELKNLKIQADECKAPILVITSNTEKNLPAAFLRRCVYYDIEFPKDPALRSIVSRRISEFADAEGVLLKSAVAQFSKLADDNSGMQHPPGTAELLDWMLALLLRGARVDADLSVQQGLVKSTFGSLVKSESDRKTAKKILGLNDDQ